MGIFKHNCESDGHKFEPRYDKTMPPISAENEEFFLELVDIHIHGDLDSNQMFNQVYIHDICIRCGKVISRDSKNEPKETEIDG